MNLTSKRSLKNLLKKCQTQPSKRLGQNFLINKKAIKKITQAADLNLKDIVLEIGPGFGVLTIEIAKRAEKLLAVEKDPKMIEILKEMLDYWQVRNVQIIKEDILEWNPKQKLLIPNYKVVGNLPFYLTAPVIRQFLEVVDTRYQPLVMVLVVQKEVGQRICAKPGKMSILAVSVQLYAKAEIVSFISKKSFWPQPKVDAAIIKITPLLTNYTMASKFRRLFFQIVKAGFSQPRKQLINNLSKKLKIDKEKMEKWLLGNNIQPTQRAETLDVEDWINLTKTIE